MALFPVDFGRKIKRYVQIADQNLGRAEKSDVLTDHVHGMEKQMELIRQAFQGAIKRLQACLPPTADPEKRLRKLPESFFSANLLESAGLLSQTHHVFPTVFSRLGEAEKNLAEALIQYTINIEKNVIEPLNAVVDKDIPAIIKLRKELTRATLDMDSAKKAYSTLQKQGQPGKIDSARDGVDAEEVKVDQCRDQLVTEMYQFFAREEKLCKWLLSVLQHQADYHRRSIELLDQQIAQMSEEIEQKTVKPVYGCNLKEHLNNTMRNIATVIEVCVQSIEKQDGLTTEGLFRIAPSASKLRKLTAAFDANIDDVVDWEDIDAHCLAGALKLYLRELPEPLMTFELYNDWSNAAQRTGPDKLDALLDVVKKLPKANYDNLKYLIQFMARITEHSDSNKMSASNLAIVIAPNLLYPSKADQGGVKVAGVAMTAVEPLITNANWFFSEQRSDSFSRLDLNQSEQNGEEYKGSAAPHKPLQRGPNLALHKAKKALAPAPPIGHIGKQRSESAPDFQPGPDSTDYTPRNFEPEKPKSAQPYERTVPSLGKPTVPPPPVPPKKSVNEQQMGDLGFVENSTSFESKDLATGNSSLHVITENPFSATNRTFQAEALDGDGADGRSFDGTMEDDGSSTVEVFSPVCSSPDADYSTSVIRSEDNGSDTRENLEHTMTTQPSVALLNSAAVAADLQNVPAIRVDENTREMELTDKTSSSPTLPSPGSVQKKPYDEPTTTTTTSVSPQSLLLSLGRNKPTDISNKSASLPTQKKPSVELYRITPRSESTDNPEVYGPPKSKDVPVETAKVRPKAPPRSPLSKAKALDESPRNLPEEATHL